MVEGFSQEVKPATYKKHKACTERGFTCTKNWISRVRWNSFLTIMELVSEIHTPHIIIFRCRNFDRQGRYIVKPRGRSYNTRFNTTFEVFLQNSAEWTSG